MTQEFIYAYKKMPDDLSVSGASLVDWEDLPEINRVLNGQYRFYGNYSRGGQYRSYLKKRKFYKSEGTRWFLAILRNLQYQKEFDLRFCDSQTYWFYGQ